MVAARLSGGAGMPRPVGSGGGASLWKRGASGRELRDGEAVAARGGGALSNGVELSLGAPCDVDRKVSDCSSMRRESRLTLTTPAEWGSESGGEGQRKVKS